jgi:hypothetical protein
VVAQNKTSKKGQGSEPSPSTLISLLDAFLVAGGGFQRRLIPFYNLRLFEKQPTIYSTSGSALVIAE